MVLHAPQLCMHARSHGQTETYKELLDAATDDVTEQFRRGVCTDICEAGQTSDAGEALHKIACCYTRLGTES